MSTSFSIFSSIISLLGVTAITHLLAILPDRLEMRQYGGREGRIARALRQWSQALLYIFSLFFD